ncbi:hypothetical protein GCM10009646_22450 [Streptomyces aureus]
MSGIAYGSELASLRPTKAPRAPCTVRPVAARLIYVAVSSEAMLHVASIGNLAMRTTDETTPTWLGTY